MKLAAAMVAAIEWEGAAKLTTDVLLHPSEGDTSFFAAFTESQQEGTWGLGAQDGPLSFLADKAHYVPGAKEEQG